ncbi:uncharacterized protein LOC118205630 [Stegodyphus dumicola]|uniref:uncharacterized protein LOC118205630 n=1 Tax=Stegodyphus dumicola TaxID=202533 RepID=UPI0015AAE558|nr:uncharacterized protein LOC118205630 [Stegodyphus dumicola]
MAHNSLAWTETLPTVLLGLRTAMQEYSAYTIAQMVYGQNIRLPGEFFSDSTTPTPDIFVKQLKETMETIGPRTVSDKYVQKIFVPKGDRVKKKLEPPYDGPFQVVSRKEKYFTVKINHKDVTVSIDRLKPAYFLQTPDITTKQPTTSMRQPVKPPTDLPPKINKFPAKQSRVGRTVKPPVRFRD